MTTFPGCRSCTDPPLSPPLSPPLAPSSPEEDDLLCDSHLVHAIADGSREAFSELFSRHSGSVFAYLLNRGFPAQTAEDAVQEAFLSAWKSASGFHEGNATGWLMRIAHRRAIDLERAQGRRLALDDRVRAQVERTEPVAPSAEDCLLASSPRYAAIAAALAGLPEAQREVIELRYLHRLTVRETAERLGVAEGTVKARASRGCARLREWLLSQEDTGPEGGAGDGDADGRVPCPRA
ncbi:RNA polymerase sigma factor [Streptomyces sp. NBC_00038]|uniref:RNA polymerase sigma factor n=1 Tax=Streptomyces sp. NBC_00038 TaxID=2903615 RepID=UPI00224DC2ED|nr:RNA polymerase sigma factor [Streptomyces sp. NBC_00038]MCX5560696.1 RNA polymerase sigma factor [Streptomyces sp. NBC_00038]